MQIIIIHNNILSDTMHWISDTSDVGVTICMGSGPPFIQAF